MVFSFYKLALKQQEKNTLSSLVRRNSFSSKSCEEERKQCAEGDVAAVGEDGLRAIE